MSARDHPHFHDRPGRAPLRPARRTSRPIHGLAADMLAVAMIGVALAGPAAADNAPVPAEPPSPASEQASPLVAPGATEDIAKLLPLFLNSSERKQFAAELETSLRQGDLNEVESRLNAAIEMGTLAIVLIDRIRDPDLLPTLQTLGIRGSDHPPAADAGETTPVPAALAAADAAKLAELQEALKGEQARIATLSQEIAALTDENRTLKALRDSDATSAASRVAELQDALQREQERSEAATRQLAHFRDEYRVLQERQAQDEASMTSRISELETIAQHERESGAATARELADAREELRILQASRAHEESSTTSELATLKGTLAREQVRGDALTRELVAALEELRTLQGAQDQGPTPRIAQLEMNGASLPIETRHETVPTHAPQLLLVTGTTAPAPGLEPPAWNVTSALPLSDLAPAAAVPPSAIPQAPAAAPRAPDRARAMPAEDARGAEPASAAIDADDPLLARADALLRIGDVSGARLLLERSLKAGNARAAFLLAETFDPNVLSGIRALGIRGDAGRARDLYGRALTLGIAEARGRMEALK